ncbi:484_t:CDS:2, partial [Diversispora eburnea]
INLIPNHRKIAQQQRRAREKENEFTLEIQNLIKTNSQLRKSSNILPPNSQERATREPLTKLNPEQITQSKKRAREQTETVQHNLGDMNVECKVVLSILQDPPPFLQQLFENQDESHAFTSLEVNINKSILNDHGPYSFRVNGELCHYMGSLLPELNNKAIYAQLYIHDSDLAHNIRMENNKTLNVDTMWKIQELLYENHTFYPLYKQAHEILQQAEEKGETSKDLTAYLHFRKSTDKRCYNLPTANEIAIILPGSLQRIHEGHPAYLPLHYVLLFTYGELGWHSEMNHTLVNSMGQISNNQDDSSRLTQKDFYSFRLFPRHNEFSTILHGKKLLQEFMVDVWVATEQNRLRFLRMNQNTLRADVY